MGAQHDGGVSVIRPHGGSQRYSQGQRGGQRSGNTGHQQQQLQHPQYQQQQQYPQQIQLQQQQYTQYNNGGGHGYVVSADGYVQSVSAQDGAVMGGQYTGGYQAHGGSGSLPPNNGAQINSGYSAGVHYNPGGRASNLAGGVNSGYIRGSMDSINSANSNTGSQLSYDSDLSAGGY